MSRLLQLLILAYLPLAVRHLPFGAACASSDGDERGRASLHA